MFLAACSGLRVQTEAPWPEGAPPASYFVDAYERDTVLHDYQSLDEYLYWVRGFYEGTALYPRGWQDITHSILAETSGDDRIAARSRQLYLLGRELAADWAKDNSIRRVATGLLSVWGMAAERAVSEDNVDETLHKINDDLHQLLAMELEPEAITATRYHPQREDDWFAL